MRRVCSAVLAVLLTGSFACAAETAQVVIGDYSFTPSSVVIKAGDTVKWINRVDNQHTVTSGKDGAADGTWDSKRLNNGQSFSYTFEKAGTYPYFCVPHTVFKMRGEVVVQE